MNKPTLLKQLKSFIASIGWKLFIWGNETTSEEYWTEIYLQEKALEDKGGYDHFY